ncbi:MAG: septal ring lytic transglycosylase RlpA family protein [Treponema sp.]|jgi:hypothetical protein|nr:septal ring lytic transglycosylase RlpA family protein [Treponema sp.]
MKNNVYVLLFSIIVFAISVIGCASNAVGPIDTTSPADQAGIDTSHASGADINSTPVNGADINTSPTSGAGINFSTGEIAWFWESGSATLESHGDGLVAAHPSLPIQSKVLITNPNNGKEVEVIIIGRSPASASSIANLSPDVWRFLELKSKDEILLRIIPANTGGVVGNFNQMGKATQELQEHGLVATHPSLPINSKARVVNVVSGKEVEVTIISRIPASANRIADLSSDVWRLLDLKPNDEVQLYIPARTRPSPISGTEPNQQQPDIEEALKNAARELVKDVPQHYRIAIIFITTPNKDITDFITGELEHIWTNAQYVIIDRSELRRVREELKFQLSGEVDDKSAVSIGIYAGADFVVTGRLDGEGTHRRLRLRLIDTQTAHVISFTSVRM